MLSFPKTTEFNKRIPKQKFYEHFTISNQLERQFIKEIETIYWKNKLSPETLNVSKGTYVTEIQVIEVFLKTLEISENLIKVIDREIPYHLVFILRYQDQAQIWIAYKENNKVKDDKFKVETYYKTDWQQYDSISLRIEGLNLDKIYENFLLQVAGPQLQIKDNSTLKEAVVQTKETEKLEAYIDTLKTKIKKEKQFNQQIKLQAELREAQAKLKEFHS